MILIESNQSSVDLNAFLDENYVQPTHDLYKIRFITFNNYTRILHD